MIVWKNHLASFWLLLVLSLVEADQPTELSVYNFASTISAANYTCVLFYDSLDTDSAHEYSRILETLQQEQSTINVARLDVRHHQYLRHGYSSPDNDDESEELAQAYYTKFDTESNDALVLSPETFMNFRLGTLYWPSSLQLFGRDFNVYAHLDLSKLSASLPLKTALVERWYQQHTATSLEEVTPITMSLANEEKAELEENQHADNSFDFDAYFDDQGMEDDDEEETSAAILKEASSDILTLEMDSTDDEKKSGGLASAKKGHFTYKTVSIKKLKTSFQYLATLSILLDRYFGWVEGYEVSWSPERRQREDEQCHFGFYLNQMNEQLRALVDRIFNHSSDSEQQYQRDLQERFPKEADLPKKTEIPNLKRYFEEMVFDYGRLPSSWRETLTNVTTTLGSTPEERRHNRANFNGTEFAIIQRMREFMDVYVKVHEDEGLYAIVLADLATSWYNIMRDFHNKLNQHYLKWLEEESHYQQQRPHGNQFQFQTMDILDMNSDKDRHLLIDYEAFHEKYTKAGIPVILSNVQMTRHNITLDYLVETCGASDVTDSVQISHKVGQRPSATGWGGLSKFELDDALATDNRITLIPKTRGSTSSDESSDDDSSDDDDDDEDFLEIVDRSITMEQFVRLHERIDTLYLHDYSLVGNCDLLLYDDVVYDYDGTEQGQSSLTPKLRIPSVIASYDLFQRAMFTGYERTWPSLFVGRKGSNSKLHLDSGATGFFMYLVSGRKKWIVYSRDERPFLYESMQEHSVHPDVLGTNKNEESNDFLSQRFPLLHRAEGGYEIIQEPGQLVYIPPNCPHAVENLEDIVGIAMNFAPREGIANHFHTLIHGDMEYDRFHVSMEYLLFDDNAEHPMQTRDPLYATFGEYKGQP